MIDSTLAQRHVERAATVATMISTLPAVATQDWCDEAARCITQVRPGGLAAITIGVVGAQGELSNIEASGCSDPDRSFVMRPDHSTSLGWNIGGDGEVRTALLRDLPAARVWSGSDSGMRWTRYGIRDLVVGIGALPGPIRGRSIIVELGVSPDAGAIDQGDAIVLKGVLPPLTRRCSMAFGVEPLNAGARLTAREQQVLGELALGKSVKQIAQDLDRSAHTVHDHVKSLHRKLNASSRGELIARALGHIDECARERGEVHVATDSAKQFLNVGEARALAS